MTELVRAAGYVRVSTRQQEREGLSLDEQKATLTTECARQDWRLETIVTEAKSGRTIENRQLALLLDQLDRGEYDVLIVTHMDRISRSLLDFLQVVDRSHRNGWSVRMMYPNVDTRDPWGKAMAGMAGVFAELFTELLRQKTREGLAHARARGTFRPGEHLRYGDEATIRRIMRWNARGVGSDTIAERLMAEGVPTAGGGAVWHGKTIRRIINREKEKTCS
jgi:DNA invertase Pin-like site-specific DNA recombinase